MAASQIEYRNHAAMPVFFLCTAAKKMYCSRKFTWYIISGSFLRRHQSIFSKVDCESWVSSFGNRVLFGCRGFKLNRETMN